MNIRTTMAKTYWALMLFSEVALIILAFAETNLSHGTLQLHMMSAMDPTAPADSLTYDLIVVVHHMAHLLGYGDVPQSSWPHFLLIKLDRFRPSSSILSTAKLLREHTSIFEPDIESLSAVGRHGMSRIAR